MLLLLQFILAISMSQYASSFSYSFLPIKTVKTSLQNRNIISLRRYMSDNNNNEDNAVDFDTKVRLKEEIASPFRKLRYFFYSGCIAGGGLGFVTTLPQLIFALQDKSDQTSEVITNLAIDLSGILGGIFLWAKDYADEMTKLERFSDKEMRLSNSLNSKQKTSREEKLSRLPIEIQTSLTNETETRIVSFKDLQERGNQNVVVLAGVKSFIKDALISARLEGPELFSKENIVIVPVVMSGEQLEEASSKGFASSKEGLMTAPYIAKPAQVKICVLFEV